MHRYSDLICDMLVAWFDAGGSYSEISRSQGFNNNHVTLKTIFFDVLSDSKRQEQLGISQWNKLKNLISLLKPPFESQPFKASESVTVIIKAEKFKSLNLLDVHHSRFTCYCDFAHFSDSHWNLHLRFAISFICSHIY